MARSSAELATKQQAVVPMRTGRSDRFLAALRAARRVVFVAHMQPDPDSLASMMGLGQLVQERLGIPAVLTQEGGIFRAENRAFVDLLHLELLPIEEYVRVPGDAIVMVDSQPGTGRHNHDLIGNVAAVIDHHVTPGNLGGVSYSDVRPELGATCTIVLKYLVEQRLCIAPKLGTALLYGIETELSGFPREATPADDEAAAILYGLADKELLAQIRHARLPQCHFDVLHQALQNATVFGNLVWTWVEPMNQPEQAAEVVDFLIRYDAAEWAICAGVHRNKVILSMRSSRANAKAGELLQAAIGDIGNAGGHERRAGGCIPLTATDTQALRAELVQRCVRTISGADTDGVPLVSATS